MVPDGVGSRRDADRSCFYTLHPTPYTLHPILYTLYSILYTPTATSVASHRHANKHPKIKNTPARYAEMLAQPQTDPSTTVSLRLVWSTEAESGSSVTGQTLLACSRVDVRNLGITLRRTARPGGRLNTRGRSLFGMGEWSL
jgi:hypothetical protein